MKVIMSNIIPDNFSEFKVSTDFKWVEDNKDDIDTLIFHSLQDSDFSVGVYISKLSQQGNIRFFYINSNPLTTIKMVIAGAGGQTFTEEFYLEDEEELLELLKSTNAEDDSETSLSTVSVQVIKDFMQAFVRGEARVKTPAYLESVNNAINQLSTITARQELQITTMGTSAIDIFKKASDLIKSMEVNRSKIAEQLKILESNQEVVNSGSSNIFNSNVVMYPPVRYMGTKPLLLVREHTPCRYLTSFVVGYSHHIHFSKNKRVKLIIAHQKGAEVAAQYDSFTSITEQSAGYASLYTNEMIATNTPTKDILRQLFKEPAEVFIVVDRLYGNQNIVNGKISEIHAVGGSSDIDRFSLNPADTLLSIAKRNDVLAVLRTTKDYPVDITMRQAAYQQMYDATYTKLDELLGI